MTGPAHHLRQATVIKLEAELADYHRTVKAIAEIEESIAMPAAAVNAAEGLGEVIRPGGTVSDPTMNRATAMAEYTLLQRMREVTRAIAELIAELPKDKKHWLYRRYWKHPRDSVDEAALAVNVDRRTTARWRREVLSRLADKLGEW